MPESQRVNEAAVPVIMEMAVAFVEKGMQIVESAIYPLSLKK